MPADHPAIPGHFPGNPLVPGVLILDRVIRAAEAWLGEHLQVEGLPHAKFIAPLRPAECAELHLSLADSTLSYVVSRAGVSISQGSLRLKRFPK